MRRRIDRSSPTFLPPTQAQRAEGTPFGPELEMWEQGLVVIGTDEAGRGPLAGPVVVGATCFEPGVVLPGINDSKALSEARREELFDLIQAKALAWSIAESSPQLIDELNILGATRDAMIRAVREVAQAVGADYPTILVDGRIPNLGFGRHLNIVKGDSLSFSIGAASILAKVHRDRLMRDLANQYPGYGLEQHKGYPTEAHRAAVMALGPSPIHRMSFTLSNGNGDRIAIGEITSSVSGTHR